MNHRRKHTLHHAPTTVQLRRPSLTFENHLHNSGHHSYENEPPFRVYLPSARWPLRTRLSSPTAPQEVVASFRERHHHSGGRRTVPMLRPRLLCNSFELCTLASFLCHVGYAFCDGIVKFADFRVRPVRFETFVNSRVLKERQELSVYLTDLDLGLELRYPYPFLSIIC